MKKLLVFCSVAVSLVLLLLFLRTVPQGIGQLSAQERQVFPPLEPQPVDPPRSSFPQSSATPPSPFGIVIDRDQSELQKLRNEYAQIAQGKAALMSLEELKDAVADAREEFSELKAEKELAALVGNLGKLIEKYPQSKAAKEARKLLGKPDPNAKPEVDDEADDTAVPDDSAE
jgi:hypothetical protein